MLTDPGGGDGPAATPGDARPEGDLVYATLKVPPPPDTADTGTALAPGFGSPEEDVTYADLAFESARAKEDMMQNTARAFDTLNAVRVRLVLVLLSSFFFLAPSRFRCVAFDVLSLNLFALHYQLFALSSNIQLCSARPFHALVVKEFRCRLTCPLCADLQTPGGAVSAANPAADGSAFEDDLIGPVRSNSRAGGPSYA